MIRREDVDDIAVVRMAHGKVSALDTSFCAALAEEVAGIAGDESRRALVLTGSGSTFSAGVDLFRVVEGGRDYLAGFLPAMERLFETLLTFPRPVVAAINGHAIAGGCILAACGDYRVMAEGNGRIGIPELSVGVPFPPLAFEIMRARVTPQVLRDLVFQARLVPPPEASAIGLIDEIAPLDVLASRAEHAARTLLEIPQMTFALTKRAFIAPILERAGSAVAVSADVLSAWESPAVQARVRAYLEKTVGRK